MKRIPDLLWGLAALLAIVFLILPDLMPRPPRYRCLVTVHDEILCFQPDGAMFRPERRFNRFVLEDGEK